MARWQPGQSGNLKGRPRLGTSYTEALKKEGTNEELAKIAWRCAREGQAWAVAHIGDRLEPMVRLHEITSKKSIDDFTDEELQILLDTPIGEEAGQVN